MSGGRPTSYLPEYCDMLIEHMSKGFSFESFSGLIDVSNKTLYNWLDNQPKFLHAKEVAFEKSRLFWEDVGIQLSTGICAGNASVAIFNMKNRFPRQWRDKHELDVSNTDGTLQPTIDTDKLTTEQLLALKSAKIEPDDNK